MRKYIIAIAILAFSTSIFSQKDRKKRHEEFQALKVAYITDKLDFTPEESQTFWPIHNQFQKQHDALRKKMKKNAEEMTEQEALAYIAERMSAEEEILKHRQQYIKDLQKVIPAKKVAMLFNIEHDFKRKMLRSVREKRKEKKQ